MSGTGGPSTMSTTRTLSGHALRLGMNIGEDNIMFGPLTVDQRDLDNVALMDHQNGVYLSVNCAALADIDDLALGNTGVQRKARIRPSRNDLFRSCGGRQQYR